MWNSNHANSSYSEGEIKGIINSLNSKNSLGYDEITTKILKLCTNQTSKPLAFIFNKSISVGIFPERLKYANVISLYKKGVLAVMDNYRPISLLPLFSKILEKAMYCRLNQHLQVHKLLATEQYGFRKGLSTEHATSTLTDDIRMAWNAKVMWVEPSVT